MTSKCVWAEVNLVHVVEMNDVPSLMAEAEDVERENQSKVIFSDSTKITIVEGVLMKTMLKRGHAADQILHCASEYRPQTIFTGTRGRGVAKAMLMGSVSR